MKEKAFVGKQKRYGKRKLNKKDEESLNRSVVVLARKKSLFGEKKGKNKKRKRSFHR